MHESPGKTHARAVLYEEFLQECLPPGLLRSGHYLLLLGPDGLELPFLDQLGVPRSHLCSVEHTLSVYQRQVGRRWGVNLFYGEAAEYLKHLLHTNQAFLVLNLDIEGSYLEHLDPMMSSVLLFAMRNPRTVIATYSTVGRDQRTLLEGVASLATLLWLAPEPTRRFVGDFRTRYETAGYHHPMAMVLRDCFWIRSHLENAAITTAAIGLTPAFAVQQLCRATAELVQAIRAQARLPLRFGDLAAIVHDAAAAEPLRQLSQGLPSISVTFEKMLHIVYRAQPPWSQRCYFVRCASHLDAIAAPDWVASTLQTFCETAFTSIALNGDSAVIGMFETKDLDRSLVWADRRILRALSPRLLPLVHQSFNGVGIRKTIESLTRRLEQPPSPPSVNGGREESVMTGSDGSLSRSYSRRGVLTEEGKKLIRRLAKRGLATDEVCRYIPGVDPGSIRAHLAVARRHPSGKHFMRSGRLTAFGREEIRRLVGEGYSVDEVAERVPASVPRRSITTLARR